MTRRSKAKRWLGRPDDPSPLSPTDSAARRITVPLVPPVADLDEPDETTEVGQHWVTQSAKWSVRRSPEFGPLVVPTGNSDGPVHRWFHLKEAFSRDLLPQLLQLLPEAKSPDGGLTIVDPFSGVGTTMLSSVELLRDGHLSSLRGYGLEVNPFLQFVSSVKVRSALSDTEADVNTLLSLVKVAGGLAVSTSDFPSLSTFRNERYFPPTHLEQLVKLRRAIDVMGLDETNRDWARLALAMTVEPASRLRRDGRALRYEAREPLAPMQVFERAVGRISHDVSTFGAVTGGDVEIVQGSAATPEWQLVGPSSADLVVFSPPYPNNIDYTEVYKTELWALSFVTDADEFREQRQATLRSHPSVKFRREVAYLEGDRAAEVASVLGPVVKAIPATSRYAKPLERMICGYADDMLTTFDAAFKSLRKGGYCVYVVGNSVHGTAEDPVMIASDVMLGRLAELAGFEVEVVLVARDLPRRRTASRFVRESVVVLRKPF
ncbi:DNA methyltransferase [Ornithinibacter aureus]|uniref:DNA methyltransferase n=1 Tax=Ornithinibacter aureus TaxID=622664 RepID=A0ABP8JXF7_9MICO